MGKHGVIRTDNVQATYSGNIKSGKFYVGSTPTEIENGHLVKLDGLLNASANREVFKAVAPSAATDKEIYVVATPELIYDETKHYSLSDYVNEAGKAITLLGLEPGDLLSVSDTCIIPIDDADDIPAVGNYVTLTVGNTKWTEVASITTETFYGKIIARELYKQGEYLNVIQILAVN